MVAERDFSTQGVAVLANTLVLNGGTIGSAASGKGADLAHAGLDHDPAHRVDSTLRDIAPPTLSAARGGRDEADARLQRGSSTQRLVPDERRLHGEEDAARGYSEEDGEP